MSARSLNSCRHTSFAIRECRNGAFRFASYCRVKANSNRVILLISNFARARMFNSPSTQIPLRDKQNLARRPIAAFNPLAIDP